MRRVALAGLLLAACASAHERATDIGDLDALGAGRVLLPCRGGEPAGTMRDCGWSVSGGIACRPDATVQVGCADGCGVGTCSGDTMIRVCDTGPCLAMNAIGFSDDSSCGGLCSFIDGLVCPPSGELFVLTAPFSPGSPYHCSVEMR